MAERERNLTPPTRSVFVPRKQVMSPDDVRRAVVRIAHEIIERNHGLDDVALVGLQTGGMPIARALAEVFIEMENRAVPLGALDVAFFRDDRSLSPVLSPTTSDISFDVTGMTVVIIDDVLFSGRTVRAALNALNEFGRASNTQLAVMVDRGHRELPIRPDYVGKNLPTRRDEQVDVDVATGVVIGDAVTRGGIR